MSAPRNLTASHELQPAAGRREEQRCFWRRCALWTLAGLVLASAVQDSVHRSFLTEEKTASTVQDGAHPSFLTKEEAVPADFPSYYVAGRVALRAPRAQLYVPRDGHEHFDTYVMPVDPETPWAQVAIRSGFRQTLPFITPPPSAMLFAPLAELPWRFAYLAWQLFSISAICLAIFLAIRVAGAAHALSTWAVSLAAAYCFFPVRLELALGQIDAAVLILWTLGVYLLHRRRQFPSGVCFALGTAIKVVPLIAVAFMMMRRQWKWIAGYGVSLLVVTVASVLRLGWECHRVWLTQVLPVLSLGEAFRENRSLPGVVAALSSPSSLVGLPQGLSEGVILFNKALGAAIILGFLLWSWKKNPDGDRVSIRELVLLPLVYLLAAPISNRNYFVLAILPLAYLWSISRDLGDRKRLLALSLCTFILGVKLPDYIPLTVPWAKPQLWQAGMAAWPIATAALIWIGTTLASTHQEGARL
jgi:hypothetical protein